MKLLRGLLTNLALVAVALIGWFLFHAHLSQSGLASLISASLCWLFVAVFSIYEMVKKKMDLLGALVLVLALTISAAGLLNAFIVSWFITGGGIGG